MRILCFKYHYHYRIHDPRGKDSLKLGIGVDSVKQCSTTTDFVLKKYIVIDRIVLFVIFTMIKWAVSKC